MARQGDMIDLCHAPDPILTQALALNAAVAHWTSVLDRARLGQLLGWAAAAPAVVAGDRLEGCLLGFGPGSPCDSPNYRWFAARLDRFAYVDRVIVAPAAQGRGLAGRLYAAFAAAVPGPLVCEVNSDPPNPGSDAFHARLGFTEMGRAVLGPGKAVRHLIRAG
jgi:predicted GNAT superfamily acetyltransferase